MYLKHLLFNARSDYEAAKTLLKKRYGIPNRVLRDIPSNEDDANQNYGLIVPGHWDLSGVSGYEEVSSGVYNETFGILL